MLHHLLLCLVLRLLATVEIRSLKSLREAKRVTLNLAVVVVSNLLRHLDRAKRCALSRSVTNLDNVSADSNARSGHATDAADNRNHVRSNRGDTNVLTIGKTKNVAGAEVIAGASGNGDRRVAEGAVECRAFLGGERRSEHGDAAFGAGVAGGGRLLEGVDR
jgi:hypothetical protein